MPKKKRISQATRNMRIKKRRREMPEEEKEALRKEARDRLKLKIATETSEEREVRLAKVREMVRLRRHNESAVRREARLKRAREQQRARRAALETDEQRQARQMRQQRKLERLVAEQNREKMRRERAENWREQIAQWQMTRAWHARQQQQQQQVISNGIKPPIPNVMMGEMYVPNGQFIPPQPLYSAPPSTRPVVPPPNPLLAYCALIGLRPQATKQPEIPVKKIPGLPDIVLKSVNQGTSMFPQFQKSTSINNGYFTTPPQWAGPVTDFADEDSVEPLLNCEVVMKENSDDEDSYGTFDTKDDDLSGDDDDEVEDDDFPVGLSVSCQQEMTVGDSSLLSNIMSPSTSADGSTDEGRSGPDTPISVKSEPVKTDSPDVDSLRNHKQQADVEERQKEFKIGDVTVIRPNENGLKAEIKLSKTKNGIEEDECFDDFPEKVVDVTVTRNGGMTIPKPEISKVKLLPEDTQPISLTRIIPDKSSDKNHLDDTSISLTKILNNNSRYLDLSNVSQENLQRLRSIPACISISNAVSISATPGH